MSTIELSRSGQHRPPRSRRTRPGHSAPLPAQSSRYWQHRSILRRLQRLSPYMLRDMGFEPADIYAARPGSWAEIEAARRTARSRQ